MHICSSVTFFSSRNGSDYVDEENVITVFVVAQFSGNVFEQLQVKHVGTLVYLLAEGVFTSVVHYAYNRQIFKNG